MATMEFASIFNHNFHHVCYKLKNHEHILTPHWLHAWLTRYSVSAASAIENQSAQKPSRSSLGNNAHNVLDRRVNSVDLNTYAFLLQECTNLKSLKQAHAHIVVSGHEQSIFLGTKLVSMYGICGSLVNARLVFDKIHCRNIFLWNAMIRVYANSSASKETLTLYYQMQRTDTEPNNFTFPFVLKACASISALQEGKDIHYHIVKTGLESDVFVGAALIDMYIKCGSIEDAHQVFNKISKKDVVLWNAMIYGFAQNGNTKEALSLYNEMQLEELKADSGTMVSALSACSHSGALQQGKLIHNSIIRCGFESNVFVGTALVDMYAKCGDNGNARNVFDTMPIKNIVSWTAMIAGYAQNGHAKEALALFHQMQLANITPNPITMVSVISACAHLGNLRQGKWAHNYMLRSGFESNVFVETALIDMYAKCGSVEIARQVFDRMPHRNVVSWNAMIAGYVQKEYANEALTLFNEMQLTEIKPNSVTMLSLLSACSYMQDIEQCMWVHDYIIRSRLESEVSVGNSLVATYAKCGNLEFARQLFDKMSKRDVVSWTAMIAAYSQNGYANEALTLFHKMQQEKVTPDSVTMVSALMACANLGALQQGKWIHDNIIRSGFESDLSVANSLVAMYGKCGRLEIARHMFDKMSKRDVVSWTAMIAGYVQNGYANEALVLFNKLQMEDITPDSVIIVNVLSACSNVAALQQGKWIHDYIIRSGFESDVTVGSALVTMYAKCGSIDVACQLFNKMSKRDVISWNAMIAGYGMHGDAESALEIFCQMQQMGMKPNHVTFVCVLSACSHAGLVDEGWQYFDCMSQAYCITPRVEHYACMVDLLGRAGHLEEAYNFIKKMPLEPDAGVWGALLGACRIHCNIELGERVAEHIFDLEPENAGYYVLLSNIYAAAGRWDDAAKVRIMMQDRGLKKTPACSLIEVNNRVMHSLWETNPTLNLRKLCYVRNIG